MSAPVDVPVVPGRSVALVTLGCARNEVDSEELAAQLDAFVRSIRTGERPYVIFYAWLFVSTFLPFLRTGFFPADVILQLLAMGAMLLEGCQWLDGVRPSAAPTQAAQVDGDVVRARWQGHVDRGPAPLGAGRYAPGSPHPVGPPQAAADLARRPPVRGAGASGPRSRRPACRARPRLRPPRAAAAPRRRPDRAAEAGVRLRPALHLLRDPVVPWLLRLPAAGRGAGRSPVAGRPGCPRARPGQRELVLVRQGPR